MTNFLLMLVITIILETLFVILFTTQNRKKTILIVIAANILTNPLLNYFIFLNNTYEYTSRGFPLVPIGEVVVIIVEALIYRNYLRFSFKKAFLISFFANIISAIFGFLGLLVLISLISIFIS